MRVGLRQGCVMLPWLFNLYIDGVVREVNARVLGRGLKLVDGNDNETGSPSPCMRPRSDPPNIGPIEPGEKQTNNND